MFSPDFYLPELDLYLELTTLRQRLVTKKNRKLRLLRELYPDVNVRLLYRKDYQELLAKYGFGPAEVASPEAEAFRAEAGAEQILFSQAEIAATVRRLGETITRDYAGRPPVLVGVLKGVSFFLSDLIRQIDLPVEIDFMAVSALGREGPVRIVKDLDVDIQGRQVMLVEDIVDTGMTLRYILGHLERWQPASLEVCALFDKRTRRLADVPIRYVGFELADEFVVGYGLDYHQRYRNLPFVARLRPERYRLLTRPPSSSALPGWTRSAIHGTLMADILNLAGDAWLSRRRRRGEEAAQGTDAGRRGWPHRHPGRDQARARHGGRRAGRDARRGRRAAHLDDRRGHPSRPERSKQVHHPGPIRCPTS